MAKLNKAYVDLFQQGPFPGLIDLWAETGRYFKQIHGNLITNLLEQVQVPLLERGYVASREVSLQILERREPDIAIRHDDPPALAPQWDYRSAAREALADPGIAISLADPDPDLDAIHVRAQDEGILIAVIEIVSPSNKVDFTEIDLYRERRVRLLRQGVNVIEMDATRSVKRLVGDPVANSWAYHTAIFLPGDEAWLIGSDYGQALKRVALPLRDDVVPVEPQAAYDLAYQQAAVGGQILNEDSYTEPDLPLPSLLTPAQRTQALEQVAAWKAQLNALRSP
jgi:hypothetical protein